MASYDPKLSQKKYNNWVKAQLAVLFTKEGIEPFVCNEVQQFQLRCLNDICYNNGLFSGSVCSGCCTENIVRCPTDRICNVGRGKCSYHRNASTKYLPTGCPSKICDHFKTEIQNVHRYYGPSYKNTDATKWCSNSWEIGKCFMPPDGYKDVTCSADTDFNGVISVIINDKEFQARVQENLSSKNNIFEQARDIGRTVRHSSSLEVEDIDLQQYFRVLQALLSDPGFLATDACAQYAKQKLRNLENDILVIGKDDIRKILDDVAKATQDKIKTEIDGQKQQYEMIKLDMIKQKQDEVQALETKTAEGVKLIEDKWETQIQNIKEENDKRVKQIDDKGEFQMRRINETSDRKVQNIVDKTESQVNRIEEKSNDVVKLIEDKTRVSVKTIESISEEESKKIKQEADTSANKLRADTEYGAKKVKEEKHNAVNIIESSTNKGIDMLKDETNTSVKTLQAFADAGVKKITEYFVKRKDEDIQALETKTTMGIKSIEDITDEKTKAIKEDLTHLGDNLQETLYSRIREDKEKQYIDDRRKLKDELIIWYRNYHSTIPLSPLTEDRDTPLANFYVMPDIDMHISYFSEKKETTRVNSLSDLFGSGRKKVPQEIYLSADAGFGKTAFSKYLTVLWCQGHLKDENYHFFKEEELSALSCFDFIFLVQLRDSSHVCHVDLMIENQLIDNLTCSESLPKHFVTEILNREKCLVILDGLDEWSHPQNSCTRPMKCIPHRYARRENCVIFTTTRPWKLGNSNIRTSLIDKIVELVQLNDQSIFQLELNALKKMKGGRSAEELEKEALELHYMIQDRGLDDLKIVPLILMYMVGLWCDNKPIGESKCQIYTSIIELLLSRTMKKYSEQLETAPEPLQCKLPRCFSNHDICQKYSTLLTALGKLAFHTLFSEQRENTLVFNKPLVEKHLQPEQLKVCLLSGILTENKVKKYTEQLSKISFSHKTIQEYFMSVSISGQIKKEVKETILERCKTVQDVLDMKISLVFISGMNPELISSLSHDLMPVINNDEITCQYRSMTEYDYRCSKPLQEIQDILISCMKECMQDKKPKLSLQDFFIGKECKQGNYITQLQELCHHNKDNIKSIFIWNNSIYSVNEIINLFALCDLQKIEKMCYQGEIVEEEMISILLNPLRCLSIVSKKMENNQFVGKYFPISAVMTCRLVKLQHLESLHVSCLTMPHQVIGTLLNFLTSKTSMKEITLYGIQCSGHDNLCEGFNIDLSEHSDLKCIRLSNIPVSHLNINVSSLEQCGVGHLHTPGVVLSYLDQLPAAKKLHTFRCRFLKSSIDIEKMLQTVILLVHAKEIWLHNINLGERSLALSTEMVNVKLVYLWNVTMSCSVLHDLKDFANKLPHLVTIRTEGCDIKPEADFEELKRSIKSSDKYMVTFDFIDKSGKYSFEFKTISNEKYLGT